MQSQIPPLQNLFAIPNGGHRHIKTATKLKREGVKAGVPDVMLAYPSAGCAGLWIEMKWNKNKPTKEQARWLKRLKLAGYAVAVCYSADEAINKIAEYLGVDYDHS
jgi:hypothetical protein